MDTQSSGAMGMATLAQAKDPAAGLMMGGSTAPAAAGAAGTVAPGTAGTPPSGTAPAQTFPVGMFVLVIGFVVLMFIMTGGQQRRERKRMAQLLANLSKHDRVLTIGGIVGTVAEIRDDEVVLKVDENSNTRIRFTKNAIQQVLKPAEAGAPAAATPEPKVEVVAGKREKATV